MVNNKNNRGVGILQVVLGGAVFAIAIGATLRFTTVFQRKLASDSRLAAVAVERGITTAIAQRVDALAKAACGGGALANAAGTITAFGSLPIPGLGALTASPTINYPSGRDALADAAVGRCNSPSSPTTQTAAGGYYLCFQITSSNANFISSSDIFKSDQAFMEVRANLVNLATFTGGDKGPYSSCTTYRNSALSGVVLYYRLYWNRGQTDDKAFFNFSGKSVFPKP